MIPQPNKHYVFLRDKFTGWMHNFFDTSGLSDERTWDGFVFLLCFIMFVAYNTNPRLHVVAGFYYGYMVLWAGVIIRLVWRGD